MRPSTLNWQRLASALAGDLLSAFGSIVALNRAVDEATAETLCNEGIFVEGIIAPEFSAAAIEHLTTRPKWKKNVRLLEVGKPLGDLDGLEFRSVSGGMLVQDRDHGFEQLDSCPVVTNTQPSPELRRELEFGWNVVRHVKSNAITLSRQRALVGVGAGQMSRVDSVKLAIDKAGPRATGSVLSSDAFFPFADSIELAACAGIAAIVQPGGSVRDDEVIAACNQANLPMIFTGRRHFRH